MSYGSSDISFFCKNYFVLPSMHALILLLYFVFIISFFFSFHCLSIWAHFSPTKFLPYFRNVPLKKKSYWKCQRGFNIFFWFQQYLILWGLPVSVPTLFLLPCMQHIFLMDSLSYFLIHFNLRAICIQCFPAECMYDLLSALLTATWIYLFRSTPGCQSPESSSFYFRWLGWPHHIPVFQP